MTQKSGQLKFPEMDDSEWVEVEPPPDEPTDAPPDKFPVK